MEEQEKERKITILLNAIECIQAIWRDGGFKSPAEKERVTIGVAAQLVDTISLTGKAFWDRVAESEKHEQS